MLRSETKPNARACAMQKRILETADRLFYSQGIRAIGVDTLAAEVGISKRTLYNHFPSKEDLVTAYLQRRCDSLPKFDASPAEQILHRFDILERAFTDRSFRGCPFVNAVAELGESEQSARTIARSFKESRRAWFRDLLRQLGLRNADDLAIRLSLLVDGAIATHLVFGDPAIARTAKDTARILLEQAGVTFDRLSTRSKSSKRPRSASGTR